MVPLVVLLLVPHYVVMSKQTILVVRGITKHVATMIGAMNLKPTVANAVALGEISQHHP